jgi:hypothetical protein
MHCSVDIDEYERENNDEFVKLLMSLSLFTTFHTSSNRSRERKREAKGKEVL